MAKNGFTHLHVHTQYSLLDGLSKIPELIERAKKLKMDSLAITDHGAMYGVVHFYLAAQEAGIKPIIGVEAYQAHRSRFDKQPEVDADQYHLPLLAKTTEGYRNLMKLVTHAHLEGYYYKPRLDMELLEKYHEGIIALSGCLQGEIPQLLLAGRDEEATTRAKEFLRIFEEDYYFELQKHPKIEDQNIVNEKLVKLSRKLGIPVVATNDVHYVTEQDAEAQDALLAIQTQKKIDDKDRLTLLPSTDFYLRSPQEMQDLFADYPDAIENARKIAEKCSVEIPIGNFIFPNYPLPSDKTPEEYLKALVEKNLKIRFPKAKKEIKDRVDYELEIICKKGFATYFLIVQDFVNWAKSQGIRVGPGRGSVAGSIVAYILRITSINPIEHNLPFERFMNPQRPSPPDIDIDLADNRRDEVIDYVSKKYGEDKVAQIITFGTLEARMAARDVARVLGFPYAIGDKIAKMIPFGPQGSRMTVDRALSMSPELEQAYKNEEETRRILDLARRIEGVARHASTHAAGVVIADKELTEYTPLQRETKGDRIITQYDMYALDLNVSEKAIGLLKMDFLGLRNLTILEQALKFTKELTGKDIDISEIPLDDKKVFEMLSAGETTGVFQLESSGMRRLAKKLQPSRFSDIGAMVALFRPGPMQFIDEFIAGKNTPGSTRYPHPDLRAILEETYGIAVYQEQVMQVAAVLAGYTLGEADILRRAIGKKKASILRKEKGKFIKRATERGYKKEVAEKVYQLIERFAGYGFNKAHSTSYAMIAYQTAYMKANFPVPFMAALMTAESHNAEKVSLAVSECRRVGIKVLPPDINKSQVGFRIEKDDESFGGYAIRFGFSAIKNVGVAAMEAIIKTREDSGEFTSLTDFCTRVDAQKVNKKVLESLIKAGAMDGFGNRSALLAALDEIRAKAQAQAKQNSSGQAGLFDGSSKTENNPAPKDKLPDIKDLTSEEKLSLEKQLLGFYLTEHPLTTALSRIGEHTTHKIFEITEEFEGQRIKIGGVVSGQRIVLTKNGNREMAFVTLEDDTGVLELVVFPKVFEKTKTVWNIRSPVIVEGKVDYREEQVSLIVDFVEVLSENDANSSKPRKSEGGRALRIPKGVSSNTLVALNSLLQENKGDEELTIIVENGATEKQIRLPYGITWSKALEQRIQNLLKTNSK